MVLEFLEQFGISAGIAMLIGIAILVLGALKKLPKKYKGFLMILGAVLVIGGLVGGTSFSDAFGEVKSLTAGVQPAETGVTALAGTCGVVCPDDGITTLSTRVRDMDASTITYLAGLQLYAKGKESNKLETGARSSTGAVSLSVDCGKPYITYGLTNHTKTGSTKPVEILACGNTMNIDLETKSISNLTAKYKDIANDDWEYLIEHTTAGTNSTTGVEVNKTNIFEDDAGADISIGADGYIDGEIYLKAQTSRTSYSDIDNVVACIDLGTDEEWDKTTIKFTKNGAQLPEATIDSDSREYSLIRDAERCYDLGKITDVYQTYGFYVKAKAGQNPDTSNDDITVALLSKGYYVSSDNPDTIKDGFATDATTPVIVVSEIDATAVPTLVFNIA